jgi:hypothetical protein
VLWDATGVIVGTEKQAAPSDTDPKRWQKSATSSRTAVTIAKLLKRNLPMSSPVVIRGDGRRVFEVAESATTFVLSLRIMSWSWNSPAALAVKKSQETDNFKSSNL